MIGSHVDGFMFFGNLHCLNWFPGSDVKDIQQNRLWFSIAVDPLNNFVNSSVTCNMKIGNFKYSPWLIYFFTFLNMNLQSLKWILTRRLTRTSIVDSIVQIHSNEIDAKFIDHKSSEHNVSFIENGFLVLMGYRRVHERMRPNEVEDRIRKCLRVINALTRSWLRNLVWQNRKPGATAGRLLLELPSESILDGIDVEWTDGRAHQTVRWGRKRTIKVRVVTWYLIYTLYWQKWPDICLITI